MKKLLSLLLVAILLPMTMSALTLEPNQKLLGHYTTDDLTLNGCWGKSLLKGIVPIATDLTPDELALFQGSKIVAFRVGLSLSTQVSRVFVIPVAPNGTLGEETAWSCDVSSQGWNLIELATPYVINLPADYSLRIGFDYEQVGSAKPISAVKVGQIYTTLCYHNNAWKDYGVSIYGNLSLQCIAENDNFPQYILRMRNLTSKANLKLGDDIPFSFQACNLGNDVIAPGAVTYNVTIDGNLVKTISNPQAMGNDYITISDAVSSSELTPGQHTLTITTATLNGEPVDFPISLSAQFNCFEFGFSRQMRLVEQFTSTYCTHCPKGTAALSALSNMRGDIAWVAVHHNMSSGTDIFWTIQCDSIRDFEQVDGYPEGSFDRTIGCDPNNPNSVWTVLSYTDANYGASVFNNFLNSISELPSWATVYVNSTFDPATRKANITINGDLVPNYEDFMGPDSKLTVYITEDGLVAPQYNNGTWVNDYVHNNVLRKALGSVKGVALKKTGNTYKNEFTVDIPSTWNADNLNIVAFISRPLGNAVNDIYLTNANKRKLGECDAPTTPGDVDGDGKVNIDDVTALIDMLLNGSTPTDGADVDGDGKVNIDDVTVLIDKLLNGN